MTSDTLQNFIEEVAGDQHLRIQDDLGYGYVRLRAAEAQRRQAQQDIRSFEDIVLEMLRNARDADAHTLFVATWTEGGHRYLTMLDDGSGIPSSMHEIIFEPFVTSKLNSFHADRWGVHGRGMALYSIRQNVEDVHVVASQPGLGSVLSVTNNTEQLGEKRDQSTLPHIVMSETGEHVLKGPHNITRTVMEFALDERNTRAVYLGSPAEIVATLYGFSSSAARLTNVFRSYTDETPYIQRFAFVNDAQELADLACDLALPISNRTAHRILKAEIRPLAPHITALFSRNEVDCVSTPVSSTQNSVNTDASFRSGQHDSSKPVSSVSSVKFDSHDIEELKQGVKKAYGSLADAYYLSSQVEPSITKKGSELIIRIPLEPDE